MGNRCNDLACQCGRCQSGRTRSSQYWSSEHCSFTLERTSTHSTNSTVSNQPGPGRTLDHILGIWGRKFEKWLARKAHRIGLGPNATRVRLESKSIHLNGQLISPKEAKTIVKDCLKLLGYMDSSQSIITRCQAMRNLLLLVTKDIRLRQFFVEIGAYQYLSCLHNAFVRQQDKRNGNDHVMLLNACREALVSVEENVINSIGKDLVYCSTYKDMTTDGFAKSFIMREQLQMLVRSLRRSCIVVHDSSPHCLTLTQEHRHLADIYVRNISIPLADHWRKYCNLECVMRTITRHIYERILHHDCRTTPPESSLHRPCPYPLANVRQWLHPSSGQRNMFLKIGDVIHVLNPDIGEIDGDSIRRFVTFTSFQHYSVGCDFDFMGLFDILLDTHDSLPLYAWEEYDQVTSSGKNLDNRKDANYDQSHGYLENKDESEGNEHQEEFEGGFDMGSETQELQVSTRRNPHKEGLDNKGCDSWQTAEKDRSDALEEHEEVKPTKHGTCMDILDEEADKNEVIITKGNAWMESGGSNHSVKDCECKDTQDAKAVDSMESGQKLKVTKNVGILTGPIDAEPLPTLVFFGLLFLFLIFYPRLGGRSLLLDMVYSFTVVSLLYFHQGGSIRKK